MRVKRAEREIETQQKAYRQRRAREQDLHQLGNHLAVPQQRRFHACAAF
jgi:hypothetical protein